jgi:hypothetical protein
MISSCRCCGVPDLLRVPSPSSCGWVLNRYRFSRHCFGFNDTVCALLRSLGSWVRRLLLLHWDAAVADKVAQHCITGTQRVAAVARTSQHFVPHPRQRAPRKITKLCDPNGGLKYVMSRVYSTAQMGLSTLLRRPQKNSTNTRN